VNENRPHDPVSLDARERAADYLVRRHYFRWPEALPWLIAIACFFIFPNRMTFGSQVLIMVMFALSLDLILGYAGIVTLGHAAFFGVGAYTVALGFLRFGWSEPISGIIAGGLLAGLVGAVVGWFVLRYRGLTLLMLTIAFAAMLQESGNLRSDITGGYDGLPGLSFAPLLGLFDYDLYGHTVYLYALAALAAVFYFVRRIVYSPFGQVLTGIRENVRRMHAIGSPVHRRLVTVYAISAAIAGVAGALFTQTNAYVTLTVFDFDNSAKVMVMLILGGTGRLYGAFIGAVVYMVLEDYFSKLSPTFWQLGIGLLLVLAVLFARRGLLGLAEDFAALFRRKQAAAAAAAPRRLVWKREHWNRLGVSAFDGGLIGFIAGFAANIGHAELITQFVAGYPARAFIFTLGGALIGAAINGVYLLFTSRTAVESHAP
jgi:branched-chain amino acid transport system permease protein